MKRFGIMFLLVLLTACANVTDVQGNCLAMKVPFPQQMDCVRTGVAQDRSLKGDPLIEEYLLTGDQLAGQVREGKLTDGEARLQLARKLNDIRERDLRERAEEAEMFRAQDRQFPTFTDCNRAGGSLRCVTY